MPLSTPADLVSAGDLDGDSTDELIDACGSELLVQFSRTKTRAKLSATLFFG
jgi:hypothetical protein